MDNTAYGGTGSKFCGFLKKVCNLIVFQRLQFKIRLIKNIRSELGKEKQHELIKVLWLSIKFALTLFPSKV